MEQGEMLCGKVEAVKEYASLENGVLQDVK